MGARRLRPPSRRPVRASRPRRRGRGAAPARAPGGVRAARARRSPGRTRPAPRVRASPAARALRSESRRGWRRRWPGRRPPRRAPASFWSRCAVLTTSPITVGSPPARIAPTSTSPVFTPTRICTRMPSRGASAASVSCIRSAARTARSASSSWATGAPNRATISSPTILSRWPAEVDDVGDERVEAGVDEAFHLLGVAPGRKRGEADEVGHEHGDEAALVGRGDQTLPALRAKRAPSGTGAPHAGQVIRSRYRPRRCGRRPDSGVSRSGRPLCADNRERSGSDDMTRWQPSNVIE